MLRLAVSRNRYRLLATLCVALGGLACGPADDPPTRLLREPLALLPDDALRRLTSWRRIEGRWRRVLPCRAHCEIRVDTRDREGQRLVGALAVSGPDAARFRVRSGDHVLLDEGLAGQQVRPFDLALPEEPGELVLEAERSGAGRGLALWIEPAFERRVARGEPPPGAVRNLLLVTTDTTRSDELSTFGGPVPTPHVEALARDGVRFTELHSVAFGTLPSHASLMTSRPARRHGVHRNGQQLGPELPLLAGILREHGFATAAFVSSAVLDRRLGLSRGFDLYDGTWGLRRGDMTVSLFADWLERDPGEPFFAWVHLFDAHQPYGPPDRLAERYLGDLTREDLAAVDALAERVASPRRAPGYIEGAAIAETAPGELSRVEAVARARYRGEIEFVDRQVGALRDLLEEHDLAERTVVVLTADHGENFLDRGPWMAFDHAGLHGEVTRLPTVIRVPGHPRNGEVETGLASSLDIATTVLAALELPVPSGWEGWDLLGGGTEARSHVVMEGSDENEIAVRTASWLYRRSRSQDESRRMRNLGFDAATPVQLFDLRTDAGERTNIHRPDHPQLPELGGIADAFLAGEETTRAAPLLDREHREALEALGYLEDDDEPAADPDPMGR